MSIEEEINKDEFSFTADILKEEFGLSDEDLAGLTKEEDVIEQEEEKEPPKQSKHDAEASELGWVNEKEWVAKGKDPEDWKPAKAFLEVNKFHKAIDEKLNKIERKHEQEIQKLKDYHEKEQLILVKRLLSEREAAVETGDVEAFKAIDAQLEQVKQVQPQQTQNEMHPAILEWNEKNKGWVGNKDNQAKLLEVRALYSAISQSDPTLDPYKILKEVDRKIEVLYPTTNVRREQPPVNEKHTKTQTKETYSMNDLTHAERQQYREIGHMYDNEQHFIKTAIAERKK